MLLGLRHCPRPDDAWILTGHTTASIGSDVARAAGVSPMVSIMHDRLSPELALRPGRFDSMALWVVWCLRRSFMPLLWIGLISAAAVGQLAQVDSEQLRTPAELFDALLSPLAGVVLALGARVGATVLALVLAYPLARDAAPPDGENRRWRAVRVGLWADRLYLTRAFRQLRWTRPVRDLAAQRLGDVGRRLKRIDLALHVANPVLLVALVLVVAALSE